MRAPLFPQVSLLALWAMVGPVAGKTAGDLQVTAVRYWTLGDVTRVAIETNGEFTYKWDRLNNPDRLFFDIVAARPNVAGKRVTNRQVKDQFLRQIRIAETVPGRTRVVLDLTRAVDFNVSQLGNPDRLMIELRAARTDKPAESKPGENKPTLEPPAPTGITQAVPPAINPPAAGLPVPQTAPPPAINTAGSTAASPAVNAIVAKVAHPDTPVIVPPPVVKPQTSAQPAQESAAARSANVVAKASLEPAMPARRSTSDGSRSLIRALGLKINRVVIDAGHGGHDVGTTGPTGLLEKELVLDVALRLGKLIEQRMGSEVIYTRQDDTFVPLEERTAIANRSHADLFLSVHANSSPAKSVAGVETFYLNFTSSSDALDVAARENAASQKSVFELRDLIQSISLHDKIEESKEFANDVQKSMQTFAVRYFPSAKDRGIKKAPFVVLIGAQMPSVLSEIGFISNPREEALLRRPEHRQRIAEALYKGLSRYAESLSHAQLTSHGRPASLDPQPGSLTLDAKTERGTVAIGAAK